MYHIQTKGDPVAAQIVTPDLLSLKITLAERKKAREAYLRIKREEQAAATAKRAEQDKLATETLLKTPIEDFLWAPWAGKGEEGFYKPERWEWEKPYEKDFYTGVFSRTNDSRILERLSEIEAAGPQVLDRAVAAYEQRVSEARENRQKREAEEKAAVDRKTAQIANWVAKNGTDNQKRRLVDKLLPDKEIIKALREEAFSSLCEFPRYEKMKKIDICKEDFEHGEPHDVEFETTEAESLNAEQYDFYSAIKAAAPEGSDVVAKIHRGRCHDCDTKVTKLGVLVSLTAGEFSFSREYGM